MHELDQEYLDKLETLAGEIQASEELEKYLEEEEEEDYARLKEMFEPKIAAMHEEVAEHFPLQLLPFESVLLDPAFEGLYLPKILGYSVLRGEVSERYKYVRPQDHFKDVLLAICNSSNFDILRKRIGQSIQMGFALSSDIWITNLINEITNKRVRYFLQGQKLEKYRRLKNRIAGYNRYKRQFKNDNYQTAVFPETISELTTLASPLKNFLIYRIQRKSNNENIVEPLKKLIETSEFKGMQEHMEIMGLYAGFFDRNDKDQKHLEKHFNDTRKKTEEFDEKFLEFVLKLHQRSDFDLDPAADQRIASVVHRAIKDELTEYYNLMDVIHTKGYINTDAQEAVRIFYHAHEGKSLINECVRYTIYNYFARLVDNLEVTAYTDLFEIAKIYPIYMKSFANQQFNQDLKELSMRYVKRLLKHYTDKRGKDYQDIKKFVSTTFKDLEFLKEKEIVELFKTRRKRKKTA